MSTTVMPSEGVIAVRVVIQIDKESDPALRGALEHAYRFTSASVDNEWTGLSSQHPEWDRIEGGRKAFGMLGWRPGSGPQEVPASRLADVLDYLDCLRVTYEGYLSQPDAHGNYVAEWAVAVVNITEARRLVERLAHAVSTASVPERVHFQF